MRRPTRAPAALVLCALALGPAACGGDDEGDGTAGSDVATQRTEATAPEPGPTETTERPTTEREGTSESGGLQAPSTAPEDQPGGAGDEIPASSQALITGRDGGFHPTVVHVPPFIAVRVQLRSADGVQYALSADGRSVEAGGEVETASTLFDGLRPGERLVVSGGQGKVTIVADAEPGP
jgi:hypothetical protein